MSDTKRLRAAMSKVDERLNYWYGMFHGTRFLRKVFNDKATTTRRLKVWEGNRFQSLPLDKQWELHDAIVKEFGKRFVSMYLVKGYRGDSWSFCVKLKL